MDHEDALGILLGTREVTNLESWHCCSRNRTLAEVAAPVVTASAKLEGSEIRQVVLLSGRMGCCSRRRAVGSVTGACEAAVSDDAEGPFPSLPDGWLCMGWFLALLFNMTKQRCVTTLSNKGKK